MLSVARQNLSAFANLEFHLAEGLALPLPDDTLDVAFANMYLHHILHPLDAILEIVRALTARWDGHPSEDMREVSSYELQQMTGRLR